MDGCYWIDPQGQAFMVNDVHGLMNLSHEEWARQHMKLSLEQIMSLGWVRLQLMPGLYLLVDHQKTGLTFSQRTTLRDFFFGNLGVGKISVESASGCKQYDDTPVGRTRAYEFICGDCESSLQGDGEDEQAERPRSINEWIELLHNSDHDQKLKCAEELTRSDVWSRGWEKISSALAEQVTNAADMVCSEVYDKLDYASRDDVPDGFESAFLERVGVLFFHCRESAAIPVLTALLGSGVGQRGEAQVAIDAAETLMRMGRQGQNALDVELHSENKVVRWNAALALSQIVPEPVENRDSTPIAPSEEPVEADYRERAAPVLMEMLGVGHVEGSESGLDDVAAVGYKALSSIQAQAVPLLIEAVKSGGDGEVDWGTVNAATLLAELCPPGAREALLAGVQASVSLTQFYLFSALQSVADSDDPQVEEAEVRVCVENSYASDVLEPCVCGLRERAIGPLLRFIGTDDEQRAIELIRELGGVAVEPLKSVVLNCSLTEGERRNAFDVLRAVDFEAAEAVRAALGSDFLGTTP